MEGPGFKSRCNLCCYATLVTAEDVRVGLKLGEPVRGLKELDPEEAEGYLLSLVSVSLEPGTSVCLLSYVNQQNSSLA